jgi:hypothetical protein
LSATGNSLNDDELPGMWSHSDFMGGDPDERSHAAREQFRYPDKPAPRAFGYLDNSGVEWAAYDTRQMEAYARAAVAEYLSNVGVVMEVRETDGRVQCVWLGCAVSDFVGRALIPFPAVPEKSVLRSNA